MNETEIRLQNLEQVVSFLTAKVNALEQQIAEAEEPDFTCGDFFVEKPDVFEEFLKDV